MSDLRKGSRHGQVSGDLGCRRADVPGTTGQRRQGRGAQADPRPRPAAGRYVAGDKRSDTDIVRSLGISLRTVERVRRRLVTEGLPAALDHRPRPDRPTKVKIKGDVEQKL